MKILLYGSTYLSSLVERELMLKYEIIGHIPSEKPIFEGKMLSPVVSENAEYDIAISVQYDKKIKNLENAYNLHTGILPLYGGCDILYHTIENREKEQGLTFHKITENFDQGEIMAKVIYPVLHNDKAVDLYKRMCALAPCFAKSCVELIQKDNRGRMSGKPCLYPRGDIMNKKRYEEDFVEIQNYVQS